MSGLYPGELELVVGSLWADTWTFYYNDGETPLPMPGWSAVMEFRRTRGETGSALLSISSAAGDITINPTTGEVDIEFTSIAAMVGRGVFALELTNASADVEEYVHGRFKCEERLIVP